MRPASRTPPPVDSSSIQPLSTTPDEVWVDGGYRKHFVDRAPALGIDLETVQRAPGTRGFALIPKRWTVERSYGWTCFRACRWFRHGRGRAGPEQSAANRTAAQVQGRHGWLAQPDEMRGAVSMRICSSVRVGRCRQARAP